MYNSLGNMFLECEWAPDNFFSFCLSFFFNSLKKVSKIHHNFFQRTTYNLNFLPGVPIFCTSFSGIEMWPPLNFLHMPLCRLQPLCCWSYIGIEVTKLEGKICAWIDSPCKTKIYAKFSCFTVSCMCTLSLSHV